MRRRGSITRTAKRVMVSRKLEEKTSNLRNRRHAVDFNFTNQPESIFLVEAKKIKRENRNMMKGILSQIKGNEKFIDIIDDLEETDKLKDFSATVKKQDRTKIIKLLRGRGKANENSKLINMLEKLRKDDLQKSLKKFGKSQMDFESQFIKDRTGQDTMIENLWEEIGENVAEAVVEDMIFGGLSGLLG